MGSQVGSQTPHSPADRHGHERNTTPEITGNLDGHGHRWTVLRRFASRRPGVRFPSAPLKFQGSSVCSVPIIPLREPSGEPTLTHRLARPAANRAPPPAMAARSNRVPLFDPPSLGLSMGGAVAVVGGTAVVEGGAPVVVGGAVVVLGVSPGASGKS